MLGRMKDFAGWTGPIFRRDGRLRRDGETRPGGKSVVRRYVLTFAGITALLACGGEPEATAPVVPRPAGFRPATTLAPSIAQQHVEMTGLKLVARLGAEVTDIRMRLGEVTTLWARAYFSDGSAETVLAAWEVSNAAVLRVIQEPYDHNPVKLEPLGEGTTTVTVTYGGFTRTLELTVKGSLSDVIATRSLEDRPDDEEGSQVHAVYAIVADGVDEELDRNGRIANSVNAAVDWIASQTGRRLRVDTYRGEPDVTFLRLAKSQAALWTRTDSIVSLLDDAIRTSPLASAENAEEKVYAVYYSGPTGIAAEEGPLEVAGSAIPQRVAAVYLWGAHNLGEPRGGDASDRNYHEVGFHEIVMAHELFHVMEAVDTCAPNADGPHVADDRNDLMYVGARSVRDRMAVIDRNRDDYYGHDIPGCTDAEDSALWDDGPGRSSAALRLAPRILPSAYRPIVCGVR